jgi:hypothetical protein
LPKECRQADLKMAGDSFSKFLNDIYFIFFDPNAPDPGTGLLRPWSRFEISLRKTN